jgi:hypothetical protein
MSRFVSMNLGRGRVWRAASAVIIVCLGAAITCGLGGCAADPQPFETPNTALDSLIAALRTDNQEDLTRILGPESRSLLSSGDEVADTNGRATFLRLYDAKHRLVADGDDVMKLEVGETDWPMPVPLVKGESGWYFDTAAGMDELLSRRIGRNELYAIQVIAAIADAERDFASADFNGDGWREYARRFHSEPGKKNGLYWPTTPGEPESPLGSLVASATEEGYTRAKQSNEEEPRPYHGYLYRILTAQGPAANGGAIDYVMQGHMIGGFAVVAWPAEYANSGLKTFTVSHHGVVYEKDLGDDTERIARAMTVFNPDAGWVKSDTSVKP